MTIEPTDTVGNNIFKMFSNDERSYKIVNFLCVSSSDKKVLKLNQGDQNVKYCIPSILRQGAKSPFLREGVVTFL